MKDQATIYADIIKVEKRPDEPNFRYVHSRISDETKDLDGQTADYDWLKTALPDWFKWGNVRDMHENNVVGKAKELTDVPKDRAFDGILKVVDPVAVMKVDEGLFTGVSIGIKGPRVINNKGVNVHPMQPGRIVGGKIVEVSLVDHPCNENCKITVAKMAGKRLSVVEGAELELIEPREGIGPAELEAYKSRFHPALANAGVALADGSYVIMKPEDLFLAKALRLTGFGNTVAADFLIKRRETEFTKAAGQTQQATPDQAKHPVAPGARENRDNPEKNAPPAAKPNASKNPDKESPAHESPDASGSAASFGDGDHPAGHPPTTPSAGDGTKKSKKIKGSKQVPSHTHGDDTGSVGTQTDSSKGSKVKQKTKTTTTWKFAAGDPSDWSDKKLTKGLRYFKTADAEGFKTATNSYTGDGRPLLEQIARDMQGRMYNMASVAQGSTTMDARTDKAENAPGDGLLNDGGLMRDGDPRVGANTPAEALAQGGPMHDGNTTVSGGGDSGAPNTSLPFATAPQAGSSPARMAPGSLPGTLRAPGDAHPAQRTGGPAGSGGEATAAPPMRAVSGAAQAGPDPNAGGARSAGSPNTAFANPTNQPKAGGKKAAKADRKKRKYEKIVNKLAKAAVADQVEAAMPDSVKAAITGILKKFEKDLEKSVLSKYATADQVKSLAADIERLGSLAAPGGPFLGKTIAIDKEFIANEIAQPQTQVIEPEVLEQIERFDRMTKSDNRQLAISAQQGLKKLLATYFPQEVTAELTKRRRSAAK